MTSDSAYRTGSAERKDMIEEGELTAPKGKTVYIGRTAHTERTVYIGRTALTGRTVCIGRTQIAGMGMFVERRVLSTAADFTGRTDFTGRILLRVIVLTGSTTLTGRLFSGLNALSVLFCYDPFPFEL